MKYILLIVLSTLLSFGCPVWSQLSDSESTSSEICPDKDSVIYAQLEEYISKNGLPGAIVGCKSYGEPSVIKAKGWCHLKHQIPMADTTPFRCGSITKLFTAVVAMQLVEGGRLDLHNPVSNYLPELYNGLKQVNEITIEQLLNHTSGLRHPTEDNGRYRFRLVVQPGYFYKLPYYDRFLKYALKKSLKHVPGKNQYYSNAGYWVLAKVIEQIEGKPIDLIFDERIIKPLNLGHTYLTKKNDCSVSHGYTSFMKRMVDVTKWDRADSDGDPAAGLISTASDLLLFGEALFTNRLLDEGSMSMMIKTEQFPACAPHCEYGLGIETWNTKSFQGYGKNGSSIGVDANLICFPEQKKTIVIFTNFGKGSDKGFIEDWLML